MTEGKLDDPAITEHFHTCAACAKLAAADRQLSQLLREVIDAKMAPTTPISIIRQRTETIAAEGQRKDSRIMSTLFSQFRIHPRLGWGLVLAVALFLFVSLVPFSYQRVTGYDANVAFADLSREIPKENLQNALATIGQSDAKIELEQQNSRNIYRVSGLSSELAARQLVAVLNVLAGTKGHSEIIPVLETVSASLFAQIRDKVIVIEVDGAGKSDAELESEITLKLTEAGLTADQVSVTTGSDGTREINLTTSIDSQKAGDTTRIELKIGGDSSTELK